MRSAQFGAEVTMRTEIGKVIFALVLLIPPLALAGPSDPPAKPAPAQAVEPPAKPADPPAATTDAAKPVTLPARAGTNLSLIVASELPERCRSIARLASGSSLAVALSARIALASCLSDARLEGLKPIDSELAVMEFDEKAAPSIAILDEVIAADDPVQRIVALRSKGELYNVMTVRMLASIPPVPVGAPEAATMLREQRRTVLLGWTDHWAVKARDAFTEILAITKRDPKLIANPVVRNAVREAERRLAPPVTIPVAAMTPDVTTPAVTTR